jgi:hypothetical protein
VYLKPDRHFWSSKQAILELALISTVVKVFTCGEGQSLNLPFTRLLRGFLVPVGIQHKALAPFLFFPEQNTIPSQQLT